MLNTLDWTPQELEDNCKSLEEAWRESTLEMALNAFETDEEKIDAIIRYFDKRGYKHSSHILKGVKSLLKRGGGEE